MHASRRTRTTDGANHFSLLERAAPVGVDHAEDRARRVQELDAELLVRPLRRAPRRSCSTLSCSTRFERPG